MSGLHSQLNNKYDHFQATVNSQLFAVLFHVSNIQVCLDKLLHF